jgi:hypothetical protein
MTEQPGPSQPPYGRPPESPSRGAIPPPPAPPPSPPPAGTAPPQPPTAPPVAPPAQYPTGVLGVGPAAGELAIKRSFWRCTLASIASFGIYGFWWFYQYRRRISAELGKTDDAALHTAGLLVPFLNYYLIYLLWKDISDARLRIGMTEIPAVAYIIGAIFIAPVFYGIVNAQLNEYWDHRTARQASDAPWTGGEKLVTFVPLVLFGGFMLLVVLLIAAAASTS